MVVIASVASFVARASTYRIATIADSSGEFSSFSVPMLNDGGTIVFWAYLDNGGQGIYTDTGTLVVDDSGEFEGFNYFAFNNNSTIAYRARLDGGGEGIYTDNGTLVIDDSGEFSTFARTGINDNGTIVYLAALDDGGTGIYTDSGDLVADTSGKYAGFGWPAINNNEVIVFWARLDDGTTGIYTDTGEVVADDSGELEFASHYIVMNDNSTVAYLASVDGGAKGIYTDSGNLVIDNSGAFFDIGLPSINNHGTIAYPAELDDHTLGIYTDDGKLVVDNSGEFARFGHVVINDSGQIAFDADLDDGIRGIFLATPVPLVASVLPGSRSVQVGSPASAFATIINAGNTAATDCSIAPQTSVPADFAYQTTDSNNALIGTPNTPVDIAAGGSQSYVFAFTPTAPFSPTDVLLTFDCTNTDPAPITVGLNSLLLVADSGPVPDIVALGATLSNDAIVNLSSTGVFAVATVNVGSGDTITVSADTGSVSLPVSIALCQTDPATGVCINPAVPDSGPVTTLIAANATPTFAFFVTGTNVVPFDPANNRIFVRFKDSAGVTRGSTSVAVRTQ